MYIKTATGSGKTLRCPMAFVIFYKTDVSNPWSYLMTRLKPVFNIPVRVLTRTFESLVEVIACPFHLTQSP